MKAFDRDQLEYGAYRIRKHIVETIAKNGEGHAGGAMSAADAMAVLYLGIMNVKPGDPNRDRFLLSAGHKCLVLYSALCEAGVIDEKLFETYNHLASPLPCHPDMTKLPGVDFSTGSLGHGLPLGCGFALAAKKQNRPYKTFVLMGDGEQGEGSNWEAAAFAAHNKLDNLIAVLDENTLQINGRTYEICKPTPFEDRYAAFGWNVVSVNGHDVGELYQALKAAVENNNGKPSMIVSKTKKGHGLGFMEDNVKYHHWNPKPEEGAAAVAEIAEYGKRWAK